MKFWKGSLLAQLVGSFSLLSVVVVSIVAVSAYVRARDSLQESVADRLTVATSLKEFQLNEWVTSQREDVLLISQLPEVRQAVASLLTQPPSSPEYQQAYRQLTQYFKNLSTVKPNLQNVVITTNGGFVLFASRDKQLEGEYRPLGLPTTYFTEEGASSTVPNFYQSRDGKAAITFATPMLDQNDLQMAAIAVDLDLQDIDTLIRETEGLGQTAQTYLVGKSGGKTVFISGGTDEGSASGDGATRDGLTSPGIDAAIAKNNVQGLAINYNGKAVVGVYRWLTNQNLALVAEINQFEAFRPARQLARDILLIGLSSSSLLLVAVYLLSRRITQPLMAITNTAMQMADGNLNLRAPVLTEDEIGILARAFNQMTRQVRASNEQLEDYSRTLEERVSEATQNLQETLVYLASIIDNMADGLLVTDVSGAITRFNPALLAIFELDGDAILNQPCQAVLGEDLGKLVAATMKSTESVLTVELSLPEGKIAKASATPIRQTSSGEVATESQDHTQDRYLGAVILLQDITMAKEVDQIKTDFISTVSHELRTPLTSVLGFAKIIKKKLQEGIFPLVPADDRKVSRTVRQVNDNIDIIVTEGERLTTLINELLDIAKMEAGRIDWNMEPLAIVDVIERAIAATTALFEQKQLELRREIEPNLPLIDGDRDRLIQVVINLLSNAIKFTPVGAITCRVQRQDHLVVVSIVDSGIGIAPEDQPKVFEKFKQVGNTLTDKPKGTGLGLPICKQIIEQHQGHIWVESELGQGSTFSFSLPILVASATPDISLPPDSTTNVVDEAFLIRRLKEHVSVAAFDPSISSPQPKTILVVDDDPHIRELLRQELEAEGYHVSQAHNGAEAIALASRLHPDLIILDVVMPGLNGFTVAATIKGDPQTKHIPIIILSILGDQERGSRLGIDRYLSKPINVDQLLREVGDLTSAQTMPKTVLVVDEDVDMVQTLTQLLSAQGYEVIAAFNSQELVDKALAAKPDMVIANAAYAEKHNIVQSLRFEAGLEHLCFFLLDDQRPGQPAPV